MAVVVKTESSRSSRFRSRQRQQQQQEVVEVVVVATTETVLTVTVCREAAVIVRGNTSVIIKAVSVATFVVEVFVADLFLSAMAELSCFAAFIGTLGNDHRQMSCSVSTSL